MKYTPTLKSFEELSEKQETLKLEEISYEIKNLLIQQLKHNKKDSQYEKEDLQYHIEDGRIFFIGTESPESKKELEEETFKTKTQPELGVYISKEKDKTYVSFEFNEDLYYLEDNKREHYEHYQIHKITKLKLFQLKDYIHEMDNFLKTGKTILASSA